MKLYSILIVLFFCNLQTFYCQEDDGVVSLALPVRNSLTFNRYLLNPTFSFVREQDKYFNVTNKREWVQFENAPTTYFANYSGRLRENIGVGVGLFQENRGVLTTFGGLLNFAYNAQIQRDNNLTFGLNLGLYSSGLNTGNVVSNFPDPSLDNVPSNFLVSVSPAINYGYGSFDFGASINNAVLYNVNTSELIENDPQQAIQGHLMYTGYLNGNGFFDESKFSALARSQFSRDDTVISALVMLTVPAGIWAQAGYNTRFGASAGLGLNITENIAVEYNYEQALGDLTDFGPSHEITLAYRFVTRERYDYSSGDEVAGIFSKKKKRVRRPSRKIDKAKAEANRLAAQKRREQRKLEVEANRKAAKAERLRAAQKAKAEAEEAKLAQQQNENQAEIEPVEKTGEKAANVNQALAQALAEEEAYAKRLAEEKAKEKTENKADQKKADVNQALAQALAEEEAYAKRLAEEKAKGKTESKAEQKAAEVNQALAQALAEEEAYAKRLAEQAKQKAEAKKLAAERERQRLQKQAEIAAAEEARLKSEQQAKEKAEAEALAAEKERIRLAEEARQIAEAKKLAAEQERLKLERQAEAAAAEKERMRLEKQAKEKAQAQARVAEQEKIRQEEEFRKRAEANKLAEEQAAREAAAENAARLKAEAEARALQSENERLAPTDKLGKSMVQLSEKTEASKNEQKQLLDRLAEAVESKNQDLKDLKKENDLSEQGIVSAPKPFKSVSAENARIEAIKEDLDKAISERNNEIENLQKLYDERVKDKALGNDEVTLTYKRKIERLKAEQAKALEAKNELTAALADIKVATEIERKRRIKRAVYDSDKDRYEQDRAKLRVIKKTTQLTDRPYTEDEFDFGDAQSDNIQIIKDVQNVDNGYYLIVAVHADANKRDEFVKKVVASGKKEVDFFYDMKNSKYYIYLSKFNSIEQANGAVEAKPNKPYNARMSIVKIEN